MLDAGGLNLRNWQMFAPLMCDGLSEIGLIPA
jgi:hypothetical protein